jgi:hypothetical protein
LVAVIWRRVNHVVPDRAPFAIAYKKGPQSGPFPVCRPRSALLVGVLAAGTGAFAAALVTHILATLTALVAHVLAALTAALSTLAAALAALLVLLAVEVLLAILILTVLPALIHLAALAGVSALVLVAHRSFSYVVVASKRQSTTPRHTKRSNRYGVGLI